MVLTEAQVKQTIDDVRSHGYAVGLRDISYCILSRSFENHTLAYRAIFGDMPVMTMAEYEASEKAKDVAEYIAANFQDDEVPTELFPDEAKPIDGDMSFDELKKGLIEDMNSLIELRDSTITQEDGTVVQALEPKEMATVVARIADIRVRLVSRFGTTQDSTEQRVVVLNKYNEICPRCGCEVSAKVVYRNIK